MDCPSKTMALFTSDCGQMVINRSAGRVAPAASTRGRAGSQLRVFSLQAAAAAAAVISLFGPGLKR